jgi:hypothetical protein
MLPNDFAFYEKQLENHILEVICDHERIKAFHLCKPTRENCMSTYITIGPYAITLTGDLTPGHHGNVSTVGYGLNWFAGHLDPGYLLQKFDLEKSWQPDKSMEYFMSETEEFHLIDCYDEEEGRFRFLDAEHWRNREDFETEAEYHEAMETVFGSDIFSDMVFGWYKDAEVGWLVAIQRAFAREYKKLELDPHGPKLAISRD